VGSACSRELEKKTRFLPPLPLPLAVRDGSNALALELRGKRLGLIIGLIIG
jgi:hypothetical protein